METPSGSERKLLRGRAHHLKPLVQVGKGGLTPGILAQIDRGLEDHELIKIRLTSDRSGRSQLVSEIESASEATCIGKIGHVAILYRPHRPTEEPPS